MAFANDMEPWEYQENINLVITEYVLLAITLIWDLLSERNQLNKNGVNLVSI